MSPARSEPPAAPPNLTAEPVANWVWDHVPHCRRVELRWDASPDEGRPDFVGYRVYRDGRLDLERTGTRAEPDNLLPGSTYLFEVRAYDDQGRESASSSAWWNAPPCRPNIHLGVVRTAVILVSFADDPEPPHPAEWYRQLAFGTNGSVAEWLLEVSYGQTILTGEVSGWHTLGGAGGDYCSRFLPETDSWAGCDGLRIAADAFELAGLPRDPVADPDHERYFVFVNGMAGAAAGTLAVLAGGEPTLHEVVHEFGHVLGAKHSGLWLCADAPVGPDVDSVWQGCTAYSYGRTLDSMGGSGPYHYNALHKWVTGLLDPQRVATVTCSGTYVLDALERPSDGVQMLKIPFPHLAGALHGEDVFYFVEYRQPVGVDAAREGTEPGIEDGILIRLHPDVPNTASGAEALLIPRQYPPQQSFFLPGDTFVDPYRGIEVEVLGGEDGRMPVRVTVPRADHDGDGVVDSCPCSGGTPPTSGPGSSLRVAPGGLLTWAPAPDATEFHVLRGTLPAGAGLSTRSEPWDHDCLAVVAEPRYPDEQAPPPGGLYYLVVAANPCGVAADPVDLKTAAGPRELNACP